MNVRHEEGCMKSVEEVGPVDGKQSSYNELCFPRVKENGGSWEQCGTRNHSKFLFQGSETSENKAEYKNDNENW